MTADWAPANTSMPVSDAEWLYPIYLVADTGSAALPVEWNDILRESADRFGAEMHAHPAIGEAITFGVLMHANAVWMVRELAPIDEPAKAVNSGPHCTTSYDALFRQLADILATDEARTVAQGDRAYVPLVLLMVGQPPATTDDWSASFRRLVIDDELDVGVGNVPRAIVVPVCYDMAAEPACRLMTYPVGTAHAYRASSLATFGDLLTTIMTHAAMRLAVPGDDEDQAFLPLSVDLGDLGGVIAPAVSMASAAGVMPGHDVVND